MPPRQLRRAAGGAPAAPVPAATGRRRPVRVRALRPVRALRRVPVRGTFDRVILIGWTEWTSEQSALGYLADARVLVHTAASYERTIPLAVDGEQDAKTLMLTQPSRPRHGTGRNWADGSRRPPWLGCTASAPDYTQDPTPDEFALAVEEQLVRYEVHILGRFPKNFIAWSSGDGLLMIHGTRQFS